MSRIFALAFAIGAFAASGANALWIDDERPPPNGANGLSANGLTMNGLTMNGLTMNGLTMNGLATNGSSLTGTASDTVAVKSVTLADGTRVELK